MGVGDTSTNDTPLTVMHGKQLLRGRVDTLFVLPLPPN